MFTLQPILENVKKFCFLKKLCIRKNIEMPHRKVSRNLRVGNDNYHTMPFGFSNFSVFCKWWHIELILICFRSCIPTNLQLFYVMHNLVIESNLPCFTLSHVCPWENAWRQKSWRVGVSKLLISHELNESLSIYNSYWIRFFSIYSISDCRFLLLMKQNKMLIQESV